MTKLLCKTAIATGFALFSSGILAAQEDVVATMVNKLPISMFILFMIVVIASVRFMTTRDRRSATVHGMFRNRRPVRWVRPDTPVTECARIMTMEKIGALLVMDGPKLIGIFTERDALNKALAPDRDVSSAKVSDLMTKDPCCIPPAMTIADAMEIVTRRQIRHLPIVQDGKVLGLLSSRDLTDWVVKNSLEQDRDLATRCPVAAI